MPWAPADATRHDKQANTKAKRRKWSAIANAILSKTGDDVLAIKTANARTEALDRAPLLFEMEKTQVIPWHSVPTDLDTPHPKKGTTIARMPDWLKTKTSIKASEEPTRVFRVAGAKGRPHGDSTATRIKADLPQSWPDEIKKRGLIGIERDKKAREDRKAEEEAEAKKGRFSTAVATAKKMGDLAAAPSAPLTRTPLKSAEMKQLPTPAEHVRRIMDTLTKAGKPIPASLQQLHDRVVANEKGLKRTPLSGA